MRIHTDHEDYDVVIEENERKEKYLAIYSVTRAQIAAKVHASWQIAMVERFQELEAEVELLKVLEISHLKTIKELSEKDKPVIFGQDENAYENSPPPHQVPKERRIVCNKAQCRLCGDIIISFNRHDFKWCSCGKFFVDGGNDYLRRGGEMDSYTELSEYEDVS